MSIFPVLFFYNFGSTAGTGQTIVLLVIVASVLTTILGTAGWCLYSTYARWLESAGRNLFALLCCLVIITDVVCLVMLFGGGTSMSSSGSSSIDGEPAIYAINLFLSPVLFFVAPIFTMVCPFCPPLLCEETCC